MDEQWDAEHRSREVERREREADRREREAERRGEISTNVQNLRITLDEVRRSVTEIQTNISHLTREMVTRKEFDDQKAEVAILSTWRKIILAIIGIIVFLSQIIPRIWEMGKH